MLQRSNLNKIVHSYKLVDVLITYQEALINCSQSPEKFNKMTPPCSVSAPAWTWFCWARIIPVSLTSLQHSPS